MLASRVAKTVEGLRKRVCAPLAIELWNGERHVLAEPARVTLRIPGVTGLRHFLSPDLGRLGAAYVEGELDVEGPIDEVLRCAESLARALGGAKPGRLATRLAAHTRRIDAESIRYHYDVSNEFYALWLDRRMVYSCAYFRSGEEDIDTAQLQKIDHILTKLRLAPGERLLDVGCGWGALALHAAQEYGAFVTGITLSRNQFEYARGRVREAGLEGRVRILLEDYRDHAGEGMYDKICSVGMFEHVGLKNLPEYFAALHRLLKDGGLVLNHGITAIDPDSRWVGSGAGEFVDRYVFPHGELPHISLVLHDMAGAGFEASDVETLRPHYARTLQHWSRRYEAAAPRIRALLDEKRFRIWRVYLAGCAHAFAERWVTIHQVLAQKTADPRARPLPWTRAWMYPSRIYENRY